MICEEDTFWMFTFLENARIGFCERCGWSLNVNMFGNHAFCQNCVSDMIESGELGVCSQCGDVRLVEELNIVEDGDNELIYVCDECARGRVGICDDCGRVCLTNDLITHIDSNYRYRRICRSCSTRYHVCIECGNAFDEELTDGMCRSCYDDKFWSGSTEVYSYHDWDGHWNYYNDDGDVSLVANKDTVYLGVELEIDTDARMSCDKTASGLDHILDSLVHYEHDGSLSDRGIEIITMPMTIKSLLSYKSEFEAAMNYVEGRNYYCDSSTGLHVHVSANQLGNKELNRLIYLLEVYRNEVISLSRRESDYARYYSMYDVLDDGVELTGKYLNKYRDWLFDHSGHGIYLNFGGYSTTIEFRMFQGTLNVDYFMGYVEFVHLIVNLSITKKLDELRNMTFKEMFYGKYEELDYLIEQTIDKEMITE